jgi:putative nucleotidyltransferase with HDIG domain
MIQKSQITAKLSSFHTLPVIAHRLLSVVSKPDSDASDVARVIGLDVALTANVLKAANSAYFGFNKPVATLTEATFRLGTGWVSQIAISSIVYSNVKKPAPGYGQTAEDLWRHSAAVAVTSDNLCRLLKIKGVGAIFTAALIHDIGKLALEEYVSENLVEIQQRVFDQQISFEQAERELLGFDHAEAGAIVAEHWNFPPDMVQAVRWHHEPNSATSGQQAVDIVHVADVLCMMQGIGLGHDGLSYRPCPEALERTKITGSILESATSQLLDSLEEIESILNEAPAAAGVGR